MTKAKNKLNIPAHWPTQDQSAYWPIERFVPYERNARTHPAAQIAMLAELLKKFGPDQPIVVDEDRIILKGHGRRLAAIAAGLEVFTFVQRLGLSEDEKRAMRIADNQVALLSGWDQELIRGEIASLKTSGYDVALLGFGEQQLVQFLTTPGLPAGFPQFGEDIETAYCCPRCAYRWSGKPDGSGVEVSAADRKAAPRKNGKRA